MAAEVVLRSLYDPRWSDFVRDHRSALPFHNPDWAGMLAECYGLRAFCVTIGDHNGHILVGLPMIEVRRPGSRPRWVSLPFTDACPPLGAQATGLDLTAPLDAMRRAFRVSSLEVRDELVGPAAQAGPTFLTHRLVLARPEDEIFGSLHANQVRRNIRRARQAGVVIRVGTDETDLTRTFYRLHIRTRRRLGVPVQPLRYFRLLWRRILQPGSGVVMIAELDAVPVAAAVFLASDEVCVYKYGASDERYWAARPNHLLFWKAIRWAAVRGCRSFDFGRTDLGDEGLRQFKARWGTTERRLAYSVLADTPARDRATGVPAPVRSLIRRAPTFVPRVLGEVLYRYTA